jgi:hypothetical protein
LTNWLIGLSSLTYWIQLSCKTESNKFSGGNTTTISSFLKQLRAHGGCLGSKRR